MDSIAETHQPIGNHLLDSLGPAEIALLEPHLTNTYCASGAVIAEPGRPLEAAYFPTSAVLSIITVMRDGQGAESCTVGFESGYGLINALGSRLAVDRVIAQVPGQALRIATWRLAAAAAQSVKLTELMLRHIQANVAQTQQSVACNVLHKIEARLCRWLLVTQDRMGAAKLPLTQEFLSFMLGVQRTTVTVTARELQFLGLIRYSRGQIEILDRAGLEQRSCECYAAVREKWSQVLGPEPEHEHSPGTAQTHSRYS